MNDLAYAENMVTLIVTAVLVLGLCYMLGVWGLCGFVMLGNLNHIVQE